MEGWESTLEMVVVIVQLLSQVQLFVTHGLQHTGSSVFHYFLEFAQIHVHWISGFI